VDDAAAPDRAHILGLAADLRWRPRARPARPPTHGEGRALGRGLTTTSTLNSKAPSCARPSSQPWSHGACLNRPNDPHTGRIESRERREAESINSIFEPTRASLPFTHNPRIPVYSRFILKIIFQLNVILTAMFYSRAHHVQSVINKPQNSQLI
jgi:hypothetical protein